MQILLACCFACTDSCNGVAMALQYTKKGNTRKDIPFYCI